MTPVFAAIMGVTLSIGAGIGGGVRAAVVAQQTAAAADNAALAAADAMYGYIAADPCQIAATVAAAHGATLQSCDIREDTVVIATTKTALIFNSVKRARAGVADGNH